VNAKKQNLGNIFDLTTRFIAPLYQRPYVWTQEKNWEPLWQSVLDVTQRRLANEQSRPYFLGAIVLDQLKTSTGEVEARQIIDGQQRLTTFQILLAVLRDFAREKKSPLHESFKRLTENFTPSQKNPDDVFKVWPTNADRPFFRAVMTQSIKEDEEHLFFDSYNYFDEQLRDWIGECAPEETEGKLLCLHSAVREDLAVVVIDLEKEDDAQLIFETLNALGTPLLPADLVKNFLFHGIQYGSPSGVQEAEEAYRKYWYEFDDENVYWRKEVRQGRLKRARIDLFLQHYVTLKAMKDVLVVHLFTVFKDYVRLRLSDISMFDQLRLFKEYSDVYQTFDDFPNTSREGVFFRRLRDMDTNMALPVLLEVFKNPVSKEDLLQVIEDLESYLVRRAICRYTNKGYNNIFLDMLKSLAAKGFNSKNVRDFLNSREGESSKWPTDDEVSYSVMNLPIYRRSRTTALVVLKAYELFLDSKDKLTERRAPLQEDDLSIEHVMPQEWRKKWRIDDPDPVRKIELEKNRDDLVQTFGNLILITGKLNSVQSNKPWDEKKIKLQEFSSLAMNRAIFNLPTWSEENIRSRSKLILDFVLNMWKRPTPAVIEQKIEPSSGDSHDSLSVNNHKKYIISRNFILDRDADAIKKANWFNMWSRKLWPYDALKEGDLIYFFERPTRKIVLKSRVVGVERFYFDNKPSVLSRINEKFGETQEDEDATGYVNAAPDQGFCLAYKLEPLEWLKIPRPEDFHKFPQLGWINVDEDADAKDWLSVF